ncbi:hypothetical protein EDB81DRAFT_52593 [Dactylonectria macrodidyma]|uniref:Uncharacterized protein n=1 Tax=Dactylonectria macrodidyma TaxID=307937 RepID=A0A9P9ER77_9HYPO|nr:hypothetical protein EDB81DRAFT_52593 [Dactylonectria macrodidyma]
MGVARISTWTRFRFPLATTFDESIFKPLQAVKADFDNPAYYGPISESPGEYLLIVDWNTPEVFSAFRNSIHYEQLLANLRAQSATEPKTQMVDFSNVAFSWRFGSNTDIRTVYFPASISSQEREAVGKTKGLVLTMTPGLGASGSHQAPYKGVPTIGWVDGTENWDGNDAVACVWCHYWKDKDAEQQFKNNERRPPRIAESHRPLAVEAFELDLQNLGAIGWTEHHVDFKQVKLE